MTNCPTIMHSMTTPDIACGFML